VPFYPAAATVTVRQLIVRAAGTQPGSVEAMVARVSAKPLDFAPGTRWAYSNTNYVLLGRVIERVSHRSYEDYVRTRLFAPAGMTHSGFIGEEARLVPMALGYAFDGRTVVPAPALRSEWAYSAGAIVSTVRDLVAWNAALAAGKIVTADDLALMRGAGRLADGASTAYGFGSIVDTLGRHARVWHNGGTFGFSAANATFPQDGQQIVVLANLANSAPESLVDAVFASLHPDVARALTTPAGGEDAAVTARVREWLHRFETGDIDRAQLTPSMSSALTDELVARTKVQFGSLGEPTSLVYRSKAARDGATTYAYSATFPTGSFSITISVVAGGKIAGYLVGPPR